ncbi:MAG TPA: crotonase/enoyl-CoA hydratase family protein [Burkholderiaceae bacterium]|jgi:enoyl-CoA hydratase|nr:crotonase/enoyl-CoA hydratase family protein [Burkholderiaceae bacterium]
MKNDCQFDTLRYAKDARNPRIARITFTRPGKLNAITERTPGDIRAAVALAEADDEVHVIVVQGEGEAFCAGYDIALYGEARAEHPCKQEAYPWDPIVDYRTMRRFTDDFMSLWRCPKPTIARVQKYAIAGGSDIALCCDLIVMEETARIGYMPVRVWGCPTTAMWTYRIGAARAKRLMFTGDLIDGRTAVDWGLAVDAVPPDRLDAAVDALADRISGVPLAHLAMQKLVVNQSMASPSLEASQTLATVFDGITRHNPEGLWFRRHAQLHGFKDAVQWRDSGRPIPEGDEARALIAELERRLGIGRDAG